MTVVYVDILLAINLAVDYLVLFGTARLSGIRFLRRKGLIGALAGALYSLIILFDLPKFIFVSTRFLISLIMVAVTFGNRKLSEFLKILIVFYICGFLFSGFMMVINSAVHADSFMIKGGVVYFDFSAIGIVVSGTAAFFVTEILRRIFKRGEPEGTFIVKVFYGGKHVVLKGFTDTGNNLSEPISGTPVAIADTDSIKKIIPEKMFSALKKSDLSTEYNLRIVPCKTVSGSVLISSFEPEKVLIFNENGEFEAEEIMISVSENVPENTMIIGRNVVLKERNRGQKNEYVRKNKNYL